MTRYKMEGEQSQSRLRPLTLQVSTSHQRQWLHYARSIPSTQSSTSQYPLVPTRLPSQVGRCCLPSWHCSKRAIDVVPRVSLLCKPIAAWVFPVLVRGGGGGIFIRGNNNWANFTWGLFHI